jgi:Concanavalin A-like lectin/glucanases superfamily
MSDTTNTGAVGLILGKGFFQQLLLGLVMITLLLFLFAAVEYLIQTFNKIGGAAVELMPYTVTATNKQYVFAQDPKSNSPLAKQIPLSDNERTGIEFTYAFYIYIDPSTFTGEDTLHHVMHKGYTTAWPLMGPGVFVRGNSNTLRVVMNTYKNPYTYIDVDNIPVRKWAHVVVLCRKNALEVYINGNLRKKMPFEGTLPYQNFQPLTLFSTMKLYLEGGVKVQAIPKNEKFRIQGSFSGNLSNLVYYSYAASYTEIQALMNMGPSAKTVSKSEDTPPYLADTYWTTSYQLQN